MGTNFDNQVNELKKRFKKIMDTYTKAIHLAKKFIIEVPENIQNEFFDLIDKVNFSLMEDNDNFYGYFLFQMSREIRFDISSPTAVNFKGAKYVIYFNPFIFLNLSLKQMESSIKHEILHIISLHLLRAKNLKRSYGTLAINMAMDIVVNNYLHDLPSNATTLELVNKNYPLKLEPYESFEYYVDKLNSIDLQNTKNELTENKKENKLKETTFDFDDVMGDELKEDNEQIQKNNQTNPSEYNQDEYIETEYNVLNTHNIWDESSDIDIKTIKEFTEKVIQAAEKGEIPTYVKSLISAIKDNRSELPWNLYLNRLMGTVESNKKKTITRRNRRQPERLDLRGELRSHKAKIIVAIDISGSISDSEFKQAMIEVINIVKNYNYEITILECDDKIRREYKVKSQKDIKDRMNIKGSTKFNPVFEYANYNKANLLIYFTDGKGENKLITKPRGYKVLWVISGKGDELSLKEPFGVVKKLSNVEIKEKALETIEFTRGGYSMNHQESIL
ncbi:MAG: hypothetical protein K0S41_2299 [Anaerocolumna sp.]|jgi:predicted metal-dependent peptidase|nr:hypothetical protein [Anaerocolumna sp.]